MASPAQGYREQSVSERVLGRNCVGQVGRQGEGSQQFREPSLSVGPQLAGIANQNRAEVVPGGRLQEEVGQN